MRRSSARGSRSPGCWPGRSKSWGSSRYRQKAMAPFSASLPVCRPKAELVDPDLPPRRLLFRLFHDEGVRVYYTHPLEARCRCSRERIAKILRSFPASDIEEMREEKVTTVTCEFCNTRYEFTSDDLGRLAPT